MSRLRFPRAAPRTRPRPPRYAKLPKLKLAIYDHGSLVEVKELDDPRAAFCREFNERATYLGLTARPVNDEGTVNRG